MRFDFLICSERSGSNLITKMLDAHPEVCGPFPSHLFRALGQNYWRYGDLAKDSNWQVFTEDVAYYMANIFATWKSHVSVEELREQAQERSLAAVGRVFYETEARVHGKTRVFVKENHTWSFIEYLLAHFPQAKYVWVVRDPRDMALTWRQLASGGVRTATPVWLQDQRNSLQVYTWLRDIGRIHLARFEDLVREPEVTLHGVCDFLEIGYTPQMLDFHKQDMVAVNSNRIVSWQDLQKPLQTENVGRYRHELSEAEIRYVEALCAPEMAYFGYARDYADPGDPEELSRQIPPECTFNRELTPEEREAYGHNRQGNAPIRTRNLEGIDVPL